MPRIAGVATPKYRRHKASGQAVVTIDGRDYYLGQWRTNQSKAEHDRLIGIWLANGRRMPRSTGADPTVNELLVDYLRFAKDYYRESNELANIRFALRQLKANYGHTLANDFGPLSLKVVREAMIRDNLCRNEVNKRVRRIQRTFKWAVENERLPASVFHALKAVGGLLRGRSDARESDPVKPVPEVFVDAIQSFVLPPVWAMIELQRLTGMRPGEVVILRGCDLNTSGKVWTYTPERHKTAHHGHRRTIFLGPQAQAILRTWLKTDLAAYLFGPRDAVAQLRADQQSKHRSDAARRRAMLQKRQGRQRKCKARQPADRYTVASYGRAIARGVAKANEAAAKAHAEARRLDPSLPEQAPAITKWHPHQLRHNAATWLRREFGLDVARVILGHRSPAVTEVYAEVDHNKAVDVMARVG